MLQAICLFEETRISFYFLPFLIFVQNGLNTRSCLLALTLFFCGRGIIQREGAVVLGLNTESAEFRAQYSLSTAVLVWP
jgi:hypothetical protein